MDIRAENGRSLSGLKSLPLIATLALGACGGGGNSIIQPAATQEVFSTSNCATMVGKTIAAADIAMPTRGAVVKTAALIPASAATGNPEYCQVTAAIASVDTSASPINMQLNMPSVWNNRTLQLGGGGFNGSVITGLGNIPGASDEAIVKRPITRGYATFGSDAGHTSTGFDASFGLNNEVLENHIGKQIKKTRDVALNLVKFYYKKSPDRQYIAGGSKGGQEALSGVLMNNTDYDGAIAFYPTLHSVARVTSWTELLRATYGTTGGYLNANKQKLVTSSVMATCDAADGVADGLISNPKACNFDIATITCPGGADTGDTCLSQTQANAVVKAASPFTWVFSLGALGTSYVRWPILQGGEFTYWLDANNDKTKTTYYGFSQAQTKYMFLQDPNLNYDTYVYTDYKDRLTSILPQWALSDTVGFDEFKKKGGKLIMLHGTIDSLVPPENTDVYFERIKNAYGTSTADFVKYYKMPGYGHGSGVFNVAWDSLTALERWVEAGTVPTSQVAVDGAAATKGRTRPLCEYPAWPKYNGTGSVDAASNYSCVSN